MPSPRGWSGTEQGPVAPWQACAWPGTCVCLQRVHTGWQLRLLVLGWVSCPLDPGWELHRVAGDGTRDKAGWKNTGQCLRFAGC